MHTVIQWFTIHLTLMSINITTSSMKRSWLLYSKKWLFSHNINPVPERSESMNIHENLAFTKQRRFKANMFHILKFNTSTGDFLLNKKSFLNFCLSNLYSTRYSLKSSCAFIQNVFCVRFSLSYRLVKYRNEKKQR